MAENREVLKEIWDGRLPICFSIAPEDVFTPEQPDPHYALVPRLSYFPLVTEKLQRYLSKFKNPESNGEMWLEADGQPLKWHYPIGVLYDLYAESASLPWSITVHFENFPESDLLHCPSRDAVESHFMSMVKEADCLKHRSAVINGMQKRDHMKLWTGLHTDKFDQFWSVNRKLMEHKDGFRSIPFRIYMGDQPFAQKLFKPFTVDGDEQTLKHLLEDVNTDILTERDSTATHSIIIQGISVSLDTSVQWLSEHLSHPDNFLHICVLPI